MHVPMRYRAPLARREKLTGIASLLRYAARSGSGPDLYSSSPLDATCAALLPHTLARFPPAFLSRPTPRRRHLTSLRNPLSPNRPPQRPT